MKSKILSLAEDLVNSFTATPSQADSSGNASAAGRSYTLTPSLKAELERLRAFDAKDLKSAVAAIKAAADLLAEGCQYIELRGTVTGELDSPTTMINPILGEQRIQVLAFPKCADVREHVPLDATNKPN